MTDLPIRLSSLLRLWGENRVLALYSNSHIRYIVPHYLRDNPNVNIQGEFSWVFILDEIDANATRLILRTRINYGPRMNTGIVTRPFFLANRLCACAKDALGNQVACGAEKAGTG